MVVRRLLILSLVLAALIAPWLALEPTQAGPRTDAAFVRSTNALRAARGLPRLRVSATLTGLAQHHSAAMASRDRLWHNDISGATNHWVWLAQNVGVGSSVEALQQAFMNSPSHRANLLRRRANLIGVGTYVSHGRIWVTVNLEQTTPGWP